MSTATENLQELVIVGAGPHALALLCRIFEKSPFPILNDQEHQRIFHQHQDFIRTHPLLYHCGNHLNSTDTKTKITVIDDFGGWMNKWNQCFETFQISHLRSPMFFHPDSFDPESLRAYAELEKRTDELLDITHVINPGTKKSSREQFFTPSKELFSDFCQSLVDRHGLDELIEKGRVRDVIPLKQGSETIFRIEYVYQGVVKVVFSKRVVLAVGNSNNPKIPDWISTENMNELNVFHSMDLIKDGFVESLNPKDKILVVGGGLTSAQLARKATVEGYQKFDVSLDWVGRNNSVLYCKFWQEKCPKKRFMINRQARGGGSVSPEYIAILDEMVKQNKLDIYEKTTVVKATFDQALKKWQIWFSNGKKESFDGIWLATGSEVNINKLPFLQTLLKTNPIEIVNNLPVLTNGLKWNQDLEVYVMSGLAALSLGPIATNLLGGRVAAERITEKLWEDWEVELNKDKRPDISNLAKMAANLGNYWSALVESE